MAKQWAHEFFSSWMLQNQQSPIVQASKIVDIKVTFVIRGFFEEDGLGMGEDPFPMNMKFIHLYLSTNPDLLLKKCIFPHEWR